MTKTLKSTGSCIFCKKAFASTAMTNHLLSCKERSKTFSESNDRIFLIKASEGPFFIYFEINSSSSLKSVDSFLRKIWLECCGHLSAFTIGPYTYSVSPDKEFDDKSMKFPLNKILSSGMVFSHEYDFGTTTTLSLKVIQERAGKIDGVQVIAQNNLPEFTCACSKPAEKVCACCNSGEGFACNDCTKKHECGEDTFLPIVNSPRTGQCGYTGQDYFV